MIQEIDTTNKFASELPDGENVFTITGIERFYSPADFWVFSLSYAGGNGQQTFFANMLGPLLRILGCEEFAPNKFRWDPDLEINKSFRATISHAPDKKNPEKIRQHISNFSKATDDSIPF